MPEHGRHCPFLNRSDPRCAEHFSLDSLSEAFADCVGTYAACPTYRELLAERRTRRGESADAGWGAYHGERAAVRANRTNPPGDSHAYPIVPLTLGVASAAR